jgi:hypothetical protein
MATCLSLVDLWLSFSAVVAAILLRRAAAIVLDGLKG